MERDDNSMIRQRDSAPLSFEQLATDVKRIYRELSAVEARCINMDAMLARAECAPPTPTQWQLINDLHRTLLDMHHDFLVATQHPIATPPLRDLAQQHSMLPRLWTHGVHDYLEVLRHRRPESQEHMLGFLGTACRAMTLLLEEVPRFADTWVECLGDIARYRISIEDDPEVHATWVGIAAHWYTIASDRHPDVGRLYHHLGVLERASLRKMCLYSKALTCCVPFPLGRASLDMLCDPIVRDVETLDRSPIVEERLVTLYALLATRHDTAVIERVGRAALELLVQQRDRLGELGVHLAVTSIAALFELGDANNPLWRLFTAAGPPDESSLPAAAPVGSSLRFSAFACYESFNLLLNAWRDLRPWRDSLAYVHVCLAWQYCLFRHRDRALSLMGPDAWRTLVDPALLSWSALARYLNSLMRDFSIRRSIVPHARRQAFPRFPPPWNGTGLSPYPATRLAPPLAEDFVLRGLVWTSSLFDPDHFAGADVNDGRAIESDAMLRDRADRVVWLGAMLAFHAKYLDYHRSTRTFHARDQAPGVGPVGRDDYER